jgi:hypothetical protein
VLNTSLSRKQEKQYKYGAVVPYGAGFACKANANSSESSILSHHQVTRSRSPLALGLRGCKSSSCCKSFIPTSILVSDVEPSEQSRTASRWLQAYTPAKLMRYRQGVYIRRSAKRFLSGCSKMWPCTPFGAENKVSSTLTILTSF